MFKKEWKVLLVGIVVIFLLTILIEECRSQDLPDSGTIVPVDSSGFIFVPDDFIIPEVVIPDNPYFWNYRFGNDEHGIAVFNEDYILVVTNLRNEVDVQLELYRIYSDTARVLRMELEKFKAEDNTLRNTILIATGALAVGFIIGGL
jgi:hypothetical protein